MPVGSIRPPLYALLYPISQPIWAPRIPGKPWLAELISEVDQILADARGVWRKQHVDGEPHRAEHNCPAGELGTAEEKAEQHRNDERRDRGRDLHIGREFVEWQ